MKRLQRLVLFPALVALILPGPLTAKSSIPRLAVYIVVDQMRDDFLDRFNSLFEGGFRYLLDSGVRFKHTFHDHAYTATGPGYFVLATGVHPGRGGVIANDTYDRTSGKMVYCVGDDEARLLGGNGQSASYRNISFDALGDWMKKSNSSTKVFAVSAKDRGAVLLGGRRPDGVYWFDSNSGEFVTSDYYTDRYPDWMQTFRSTKPMNDYVGLTWTRLMNDEAVYFKYSREDNFAPEASGDKKAYFPHSLPKSGGKDPVHFSALWETPWLDYLTLDLAREIMENEHLGEDEVPDLLAIALSAADGVGHRFGPYSQEVLDMFLRLDVLLGDLFTYLDQTVGLENVLLVLTSDHGVAMMPEYAQRLGIDAGRVGRAMDEAVSRLKDHLAAVWGYGRYIENYSNGSFYYDMKTLEEKGISRESMDRTVSDFLMKRPFIQKIVSRTDLTDKVALDPVEKLWRNQFHPDLSGDLFVTFRENYIWKDPVGTGHGTVYPYDRQVPLIFAGSISGAKSITDTVRTVDIAPTLANLLGIQIPDNLDGRVLEIHKPVRIPASGGEGKK